MNKFSALLIGATLLAGGSFAAMAAPAQQSASPTSHDWIQPASIVAVSSTGAVAQRGEASSSGSEQRTTAQPMAQTNSRATGARSGMALTRAQVRQELKDFQRNPVTADGYQYVNGEIGYVYVGRQTSDN